MKTEIFCGKCPNMPWEERPANCDRPLWRYSKNPIITKNAVPKCNSIFNSAVIPFGDGFAGVFRCDNDRRQMRIHAGFSKDALNWEIEPEPLTFASSPAGLNFEYAYDPRVCKIDDDYIITWCNGYESYPTIGIAKTRDFKKFEQLENAFLPFNRNGVMFPRKINGMYAMLSRPSDNGHTPFGDIFISYSPDLKFWGGHRLVMKTDMPWESTKIGAGPIPIETSEGWLLIYHGVLTSCSGYVYHFGAALLDLDDPSKVIARGQRYLLAPETPYERYGDVPNVCFPCATLCDSETGRLAVYYGCADTVTGVAFGYVDDIISYIKNN